MAQTENAQIVILWDHQLVAAAQALERAYQGDKEKVSDEEGGKLWAAAMQACHAAIYSPELARGVQVCVLSAKRAVAEAAPAPASPATPAT